MQDEMSERELKERLSLIESMIAEGRRTTESWGWTFVFWGLAYYVAIAWTSLGHYPLAWLITMMGAWLLMMVIIWKRKAKKHTEKRPTTTVSRAIFSVWLAMGFSLTFLLLALGFSGRFNGQVFVAVVGAMLGTSNAACGLLLKWKAQFACAVVWWAAAVAACFASESQTTMIFLGAIFLCQIVFGGYVMWLEARRGKLGAAHA